MSTGAPPVPALVCALVATRATLLPVELLRGLSTPASFPSVEPSASFVVTGIGASEGPARYLAMLLQLAGRRAVYTPLSTFLVANAAALGDTLVVFSQGLSPNARLALRRAAEHRRAILFTSAAKKGDEGDAPEIRAFLSGFRGAGGDVVVMPPDEEPGTFVRVLGPAVARLVAARFVATLSAVIDSAALARVPTLAAEAAARVEAAVSALPPDALRRRLGFVVAGPWLEGASGLRSTWLEGLGAPEPALWDVLQIAHGPFHQFFDEEMTLVTLEHEGAPQERDLFDRLASMLVPPRHAIVRLRSRLPAPLGALEHDALSAALLVRAFGEGSKDIAAAGGLGPDALLYGLGRS
jgi:hypothetical protein